jgi:hypothetical protein
MNSGEGNGGFGTPKRLNTAFQMHSIFKVLQITLNIALPDPVIIKVFHEARTFGREPINDRPSLTTKVLLSLFLQF